MFRELLDFIVTRSSMRGGRRVLMLHDYPPVSGGGLALSVLDLTSCLPGSRYAVLSSRFIDHYADD